MTLLVQERAYRKSLLHNGISNIDAPIGVNYVVIDPSMRTSQSPRLCLVMSAKLPKVEFISTDRQSRITHVENSAFRYCFSLGSLYRLPSSLSGIGSWAFASCHQIHLPDGIQCNGEGAFQICAPLVNIRIPSSVRVIHTMSFRACKSLRSIELPPTLGTIERLAFDGHVPSSSTFTFQSRLRLQGTPFSAVAASSNGLWVWRIGG